MLYSVAVTLAEVGMTLQYKGNEETGPSPMMRKNIFFSWRLLQQF